MSLKGRVPRKKIRLSKDQIFLQIVCSAPFPNSKATFLFSNPNLDLKGANFRAR